MTTLPNLNKKIWGLHPKKLTIIGARTSHGKSALALQMAWDVAKQNISTLFLSLEMYEEDVIERLFCMTKKINNIELLTGNFFDYQKEWFEFQNENACLPLVITDMVGKTWEDIDRVMNSLIEKPKLVIIDHLQEAKDAFMKDKKEIIDEYLKKLRELAIRNNFALIVCSQINRTSQQNDEKQPQLHYLKGSGYIEEGADIILLLHWPYHQSKKIKSDKNKFIINVAKNRNGRTGWIELKYTPEYYLFEDVEEKVEIHKSFVKNINEKLRYEDIQD